MEDVIDFEGVNELVLEAVKDSDPLLETDFDGEGEKEEVLEGEEDFVKLGESVVDLDGLFEGLIELETVREGLEEGLEDLVEEDVEEKLILTEDEGVMLEEPEGEIEGLEQETFFDLFFSFHQKKSRKMSEKNLLHPIQTVEEHQIGAGQQKKFKFKSILDE